MATPLGSLSDRGNFDEINKMMTLRATENSPPHYNPSRLPASAHYYDTVIPFGVGTLSIPQLDESSHLETNM